MKFQLNYVNYMRSLSLLGFLVCFLGFNLYHLGIYNQFWGSGLLNLFGVSVLIYFVLIIPFIKNTFENLVKVNILISFIFLGMILNSVLVSMLNIGNSLPFQQSIEFIVMLMAFFLMGFSICTVDIGRRKTYLILFFIITLMVLNATIFKNKFTLKIEGDDEASGYQTLARNYLVFSLFVYSMFYDKKINILIFLLIFVSLFLIGARSEMVAFVIVGLIFNFIELFTKKRKNIIFIFLFGLIILSQIDLSNIESRQLQVFNVDKADSWIERKQLDDKAINTIKNHYIIGDFGSHLVGDNVGKYAHNYLSGYVNYGFLFILIYFIIYLYVLWKNFALYQIYDEWSVKFFLMLNLICFILLLTSKPVFWPIFYLGWGGVFGILYIKNVKEKYNVFKY